MHTISRDSPCYYLTSVAKDRLPVFRTDEIKVVTCVALDEARHSGKFALYAYVIMPDHLHVVTDSRLPPSRTLQFINGIVSRRVIDYLKLHSYEMKMLMQRVHYTHQNPVRANLVQTPGECRWSSIRYWNRGLSEDEPLRMDIDRIKWRSGGGAS